VTHALGLLHLLRDLASADPWSWSRLHQLNERSSERSGVLLAGGVWLPRPGNEVIAPDPVRRVYGVEMVPAPNSAFACRPRKTRRHEPRDPSNACALAAAIALTIQFGRGHSGNLLN